MLSAEPMDLSELSLSTSQSSATEQFQPNVENGHITTPPPYRPAPDYETALKQPSLDEYHLAMWRSQTGTGNHSENFSSLKGNSYILMAPEGPICWPPVTGSNPELNATVQMAQRYFAQNVADGFRTFASTEELSMKKMSKSSPDLVVRQRLDLTMENLTDLGGQSDLRQSAAIERVKRSDPSAQMSVPSSSSGSRDVSTSVSRDCSSSTVCSGQQNGHAGFEGDQVSFVMYE